VALRRHRDQITWTELDLGVTRTDPDTTRMQSSEASPGTLVLTHHPTCG
jgi:hypothetical protein